MKRIIALSVILFLTAATVANETKWSNELVLPTDEGKWYFTAAGDIDFEITGPTIDALKAQTHYRHIPANDPIYARYADYIGPTPSVFIQRANGHVVFKVSGIDFPKSAAELDKAISRCRPKPQPTPLPAPKPDRPNIDITIVPDVFVPDTIVPDEENEGLNLLLLAISALGGAAGGYFNSKGEE